MQDNNFDMERKRRVVEEEVVVEEAAQGQAGSPKSRHKQKELAHADPLDRGPGNPARKLQSANFIAENEKIGSWRGET